MPTTLVGLGLFATFLVPGFLNYLQRRARIPQWQQSSISEVATLVSVSIASNLAVLGLFAIVSQIPHIDAPDLFKAFVAGRHYVDPRVARFAWWGLGLFVASCVLSTLAGLPKLKSVARFLVPESLAPSSWYRVLNGPEDVAPKPKAGGESSLVYAGCELEDGRYIGGYVAWFSVDVEEHGDRDIVLYPPLQLRTTTGETIALEGVDRVILSARDIKSIYVSYRNPSPDGSLLAPTLPAASPREAR